MNIGNGEENQITYMRHPNDNTLDVLAFVGAQPPYPICGGSGEYDDNYGTHGCNPCNSRLIAFVNADGVLDYADWGDTLIRSVTGIVLVKGAAE